MTDLSTADIELLEALARAGQHMTDCQFDVDSAQRALADADPDDVAVVQALCAAAVLRLATATAAFDVLTAQVAASERTALAAEGGALMSSLATIQSRAAEIYQQLGITKPTG